MEKKLNTKNLFLIDSLAIIFRAYHAIPSLQNEGENVNAIYGFFSILLKILSDYQVDYLLCAFDSKTASTTRKEKFSWYKTNRKETPDELISQIIHLKDILNDIGIPIVEMDRYEADDVIATMSNTFSKYNDTNIYIVTGDKDLLQLVDKNISVITPSKTFSSPNILNTENVSDFLGFDYKYITTYKALMGDPSDNIPGVKGIGDKSAKDLISEFGDIYNIYNNLDSIKESIKSKLIAFKKDAFDSYQAANLFSNLNLEHSSLDNIALNINTKKLAENFEKYNFKSLISRYLPQLQNKEEVYNTNLNVTYINTKEDFKILEKLINDTKQITFLSFTDKIHNFTFQTKPLGLIINVDGKSFNIFWNKLDKNIFEKIRSIFEDPKILKIGYDIKFEKYLMYNIGITIKASYFDTQIASFVCLGKILGFKNIVFESLGISCQDSKVHEGLGEDIYEKKHIISNMASIVELIVKLYKYFDHILLSDKKLQFVFYDVNLPLIDILFDMEKRGVLIDTNYLNNLYGEFGSQLNSLSQEIFKLSGVEFNISSSQQLSEILFNKLNLPSNLKKTKTGKLSTDIMTLSEIKDLDPIIPLIIKYKELSKVKSTYTKNLVDMTINSRLHTTYNIVGTSTGRISSVSPNLQNIPIKTENGGLIRKAFISNKGNTFFSFDYSQIELRILAFYSNDKTMKDAFSKDQDIHLYTASIIFKKDMQDISKDERSIAKTINFGIIYGLSAFGLSRQLHISRTDATKFINEYFDTFSGIKKYYDYIIDFVKKNSFVETMYGTRRYFNLTSGYRSDAQIEREAINMPIQGSSADIIKIAMKRIYDNIENKYPACLILQIHDELIFEVEPLIDDILFVEEVIKYMTDFKLNVPLKVDVRYGKNWKDLKEFKL